MTKKSNISLIDRFFAWLNGSPKVEQRFNIEECIYTKEQVAELEADIIASRNRYRRRDAFRTLNGILIADNCPAEIDLNKLNRERPDRYLFDDEVIQKVKDAGYEYDEENNKILTGKRNGNALYAVPSP